MKFLALALGGIVLAGCAPARGPGGGGSTEESLYVQGASMEPTLHCAKPAFGCRAKEEDEVVIRAEPSVERGEIVAFDTGAEARAICGAGGLFVKRVVAVAGDRVSFADGAIHVDGRRLREPYVNGTTDPAGAEPVVVPRRHVYVLGDNRRESCDSRIWGPLAVRRIVGVAVAVERDGRRLPLR
jgi:signal peptidase I